MTEQTGREPLTEGVFQVGVMVSDVEECLKLFCDTLGMKVVFDARNQVQPAKGLSGVEYQVMNCLMLHGEGGVDLPALETAFAPRCYVLQLRDQTRPAENIWKRAGEDTLRGLFLQDLRQRWEAAADEEERQKIALAVRFGLAALEHREEPLP